MPAMNASRRSSRAAPTVVAAVACLALIAAGCGSAGSAGSPADAPMVARARAVEGASPAGTSPAPRPPVVEGASPASLPGASPGTRPSTAPATPPTVPPSPPVPGAATRVEVQRLQAAVDAAPNDPEAQLALGQALLQLVRDTLDASLYAPAEAALETADRLQPDDARVLAALGALHAGRHEFADALRLGWRAVELSPGLAAAHGIVVDALVELGRYDEADAAAGRMLAVGDDLGTLARLSYLRELHGDLDAARTLMTDAASRPVDAPENRAFALSIRANLERWTRDPTAARATWNEALDLVPDHPPSLAGLARLAVAEGDLAEAERLFARAADIVPLPEYVIALGEVQDARGDHDAAARSYALATAEIQLFAAGGVSIDQELALFEADHGDPASALVHAKAAYRAAPTIRAADALAWALHRLGRDDEARRWTRKALRLGTRDPLLRFHAGAIQAAAGDVKGARRDLRLAIALDPGFSAAGAAEARALLERLGD